MTDLFDEVEEQLRSDRYRTLARKALPWVLALAAAALAAALGVWGWRQYQQQVTDKASIEYTAGLEALSQGRVDLAASQFGEAAKSQAGAYKSLALIQLGGIKMASGAPDDVKAAVAFFDQAASAAPDDIIGDAARLKSALAILDVAPFIEVEGRLAPLMQQGHPYRLQAREALAFAKLMKGDATGARGDFVVLQNALEAPESARQRAGAAINLIDSGSAKVVPAAVKAALALPPPTLAAPSAAAGSDPATQEQAPPQQ